MKRFVVICLCFLLAFGSFITGNAETEPVLLPGDVNFDGKITVIDALEALKIAVLKYDPFPPKEDATQQELLNWYYFQAGRIVANVDNDNAATAKDALWILQYVVGKRNEFALTDITQSTLYDRLPLWPDEIE